MNVPSLSLNVFPSRVMPALPRTSQGQSSLWNIMNAQKPCIYSYVQIQTSTLTLLVGGCSIMLNNEQPLNIYYYIYIYILKRCSLFSIMEHPKGSPSTYMGGALAENIWFPALDNRNRLIGLCGCIYIYTWKYIYKYIYIHICILGGCFIMEHYGAHPYKQTQCQFLYLYI